MHLASLIDLAAARYPEAEAIIDGDRRLTYHAWQTRIRRVAHALHARGIRPGDHVVFLLKNRLEHATAYWACQRIGAIATPLNWRWSAGDISFCVQDAEAVAVICEPASHAAAQAVRPSLSGVHTWIYVGDPVPTDYLAFSTLLEDDGAAEAPSAAVSESDISIMLYTSGTTGRPKGVPRTHRAEYSAALAHSLQSRNSLQDRTLGVMPLYHTMGIRSTIVMALLNGCLICLPDWSPEAAARLIVNERISALYLVPTLYHDLINASAFSREAAKSVTKLGYAGAPMSGTLTRRVAEMFQPQVFVNHLGSTEIYTFTICDRILEKPTCAGRAGVFSQVRIVRADADRRGDPDDILPRGETGELIVSLSSPEAFQGYWRRPEADAKALRGGWYFSGDLVYADEDGDIFTVGRVDDMIISGGENIYPIEVEEVVSRHPQVDEACVVGLSDQRWGQVVTALVVPKRKADGSFVALSAADLDTFCRQAEGFADFKRPRRYEFVSALPKSPTGKLLRRRLLEGGYETL